jgi:TolB protein
LWIILLLAAGLSAGLAGWASGLTPDDPSAGGVIAFVNAATGDEIRLIEPDGSNNRRLWAHNLPDPSKVYAVDTLSWRPNAAEIAFSSSHESWCSINHTDIFAVAADGSNYRRITQAPSCAGLSAYPQGTIRVPVENNSIFGESFTGFVYFQGASSALPVSLPPGGSTTLTFKDVADFGDGELQVGAIVHPSGREISFATAVDVQAGQTVTTGKMDLYVPSGFWEAHSPTWRSSGDQIGYVLNFAGMFALPPNPPPLALGQELQTDQSAMPDFADHLAWGPPSRAKDLLYRGSVSFDAQGVYLTREFSATAGQRLFSYEVWEYIRGLAWLPDGSGFIYSVEESNNLNESVKANIFEYNFASKQSKRLTNFADQFAGEVSVSPDGKQIVFDRSAFPDSDAPADLYVINRDGSGLRLLAKNGRSPAWSPGALKNPQRLYLPAVLGAR